MLFLHKANSRGQEWINCYGCDASCAQSKPVVFQPSHANYLQQRGVPRQPGDLTAHDCILYTLLAAGNASWPFKDGDIKVSGHVRLNSLEGIRRAVLNGLGIACLPAWMVTKELQSGELVALLTVHAAPPVPVNILYSAEQRLSQRASVFMAFIAQVLADIPGLNSSKTPR